MPEIETRILSAEEEDMKTAVSQATALLAAGEIVAVPTETVYGLAADAFNADAVAKVFAAKERPAFDPLIVHISSLKELPEVAELPEDIAPVVKSLAGAFWPGPLTIVLPKSAKVPDIVTSGLPTVAVRQSGSVIFRQIGKALGRPIAAPSANRFGRISPTSASAVMKELDGRIPLIIDGGACSEGVESTIVKIESRGEQRPLIHVLRAGPVTKEDLQKFGKVVIQKRLVSEHPEAPGQLASHYAPLTPLLMFEKPEDFKPEPGKKYGLLSYRGDPKAGYIDLHEWEVVEELSPGSGKLIEAAVRLFYVMRHLDEQGLDAIVAEPVSETGLGVAIMDRLRRAAVGRE
ncbi:L-threonylcarbamoyladenylate synthase [Luteolibacter flavescens]|uniref:Threonylcarbamoyl-AMP synthase n=1 Tax=Luteolibacter flavescens TaxID=1859460 RepID=A0ABT3FU83_9BACT|nr:L-threonylcarbamoyladenylate synthase [Luteolibacter flavescens]MCW1887130.1 L-threonylcarbamoyladenylate synthase [Luteolibacter flavescens]